MTSLYKQSIPVMIKYMENLSGIVKKGETFCSEKGMKEEEMLNFRLYEDMRPLTYQVQNCSNTAKFLAHRVGGIENIYLEDNESTFAELYARIDRTISILKSVPENSMDGKENAEIRMDTRAMGSFRFTGQGYVTEYAIPNFHFHLTTAYCILRHLGVPVGAFDYMRGVFEKIES